MPPSLAASKRFILGFIFAAGALVPSAATRAGVDVVASIKPLHSLVAGVMQGVGEPTLLLRGMASPHTYSLRPSEAQALAGAEIVFWVGEGLELFLTKPLASLAEGARIVTLDETPGLTLLAPREGGLWEPHDDDHADDDHAAADADEHDEGEGHADEAEHAEHEHEHAAYDSHLWLDPRNTILLVAHIAAELGAADPAHAEVYARNASQLAQRIDALDAELSSTLAPVRAVPFIVFHDAYQYLEAQYGLAGVGSITIGPEQPPGARRLQEIRARISDNEVRCVFREPNFDPALVDRLVEGTEARTGALDPEGAALAEGPQLYFELMRGLADSLRDCLGGSS